ncbi:MAG TPA: DUF4386 domain-containing protein, partial [Aggregatilineaceae bacterium]|nr:DUF4386 domain-containing protein [Aggregatilineaceae bacterium]
TAGSMIHASDYMKEIPTHENRVFLGSLFVLIMGLALAMVPVVAFPVLKKQNETLALGYLVFRGALETVTYIVIVICWLVLVPFSEKGYETAGTVLVEIGNNAATMTAIIFPLAAIMLYSIFYQSRLIPRWISGWGLVAIVFALAAALLDMFDVIESESSAYTLLVMPIALQEMVMAIWLIVKGFNPKAGGA